MSTKNSGACGLDCTQCGACLALQNNDDALRKKTAVQWNTQFASFGANFTPEQIDCVGCLREGIHSGYCCECPLRQCALTKTVENCGACDEFENCDTRKKFEEITHMSIRANCAKL